MTINPKGIAAFAIISILFAAHIGSAQEGFPLDGTWRGSWSSNDGSDNAVVIVMKWDGSNIQGVINPGPNSTPFASAMLEPSTWTVHIAAEPKDAAAVSIVGTLQDIGAYNRFIQGTWTQSGSEHNFRITRE
jgi:hypothetical protein